MKRLSLIVACVWLGTIAAVTLYALAVAFVREWPGSGMGLLFAFGIVATLAAVGRIMAAIDSAIFPGGSRPTHLDEEDHGSR